MARECGAIERVVARRKASGPAGGGRNAGGGDVGGVRGSAGADITFTVTDPRYLKHLTPGLRRRTAVWR